MVVLPFAESQEAWHRGVRCFGVFGTSKPAESDRPIGAEVVKTLQDTMRCTVPRGFVMTAK